MISDSQPKQRQAFKLVDASARGQAMLTPDPQHWRVLSELTRKAKLQGEQFHDARMATICLENGVSVLWSADRDFGRFRSLKTVNPLVQ